MLSEIIQVVALRPMVREIIKVAQKLSIALRPMRELHFHAANLAPDLLCVDPLKHVVCRRTQHLVRCSEDFLS